MAKNKIPSGLLTKAGAAKLLGISVSTFDRLRQKRKIQPADTLRQKPVLFYETHVRLLLQPLVTRLPGDRILSLKQIRTIAGRPVVQTFHAKGGAK